MKNERLWFAKLEISISGVISQKREGNEPPLPLVGIKVRAVHEADTTIHEQETNEEGRYTFTQFKAGRWTLSAEGEGYKSPPPIIAIFDRDTDTQNFEMVPIVEASGTVYWYGSDERSTGAIIRLHQTREYRSTPPPMMTATLALWC